MTRIDTHERLKVGRAGLRALLAVATAAAALGATAQNALAEDCRPVEVIGSRGSGDTDYFGGPHGRVMLDIRGQIGADRVYVRANPYPAVGLTENARQLLNALGAGLRVARVGAYHDSVEEGKRWLTQRISKTVAGCGDRTWIVLTGYSQGAQVTSDVYQDLPERQRSRIAGMILFGDPYFRGDSPGRRGDASPRADGVLGTRPAYSPKDGHDSVRSYCHRRDPICQGNDARFALAAMAAKRLDFGHHTNYAALGEPEDAARWMSTRLRTLPYPAGSPGAASPSSGSGGGGSGSAAAGNGSGSGTGGGGTSAPTGTTTFTVTGTCRAGCGLTMFRSPDHRSAATRTLPDGTALQIVCQTRGATLSEVGYTSAIWDKTSDGEWASDLYLNTPVYGDFSPGIPRCDEDAPTPPAPPAPPTPPTPPAVSTQPFTVTGTCRAGCGLWMFRGPDHHSGTTRNLPDGTVLQIVCQTRGATLSEAGYTSAIWDKTADGDWASDLYLNTPVYGDFSPGIPRC